MKNTNKSSGDNLTKITKVSGKDLIRLGWKPAKWFKEALEIINSGEHHFNSTKELNDFLDSFVTSREPSVEYRDQPVDYEVLMTTGFGGSFREYEKINKNILSVQETMREVLRSPVAKKGWVMPDACPVGPVGTIPVGGVVEVDNAIVPDFHSSDVCCSMYMSTFPGLLSHFSVKDLMDVSMSVTHFGYGKNECFSPADLTPELKYRIENNPYTMRFLDSAIDSLGTQGDGNHFLSWGIDADGHVNLTTHHGSRSFGAKVFKMARDVAQKMTSELTGEAKNLNPWIPFNTPEGRAYWEALLIIQDWTINNHKIIHDQIARVLKIDEPIRTLFTPHNFVFKRGDSFFHAKGATPMADDFEGDLSSSLRVIPMNMSDGIHVASAAPNGDYEFAPHGAGRNVSRSEHKKLAGDNIEEIVSQETDGVDVRFYTGKPDISELPSAYKDAATIKGQIQHFRLANIIDTIHPLGCIMAGEVEQHWKKKK